MRFALIRECVSLTGAVTPAESDVSDFFRKSQYDVTIKFGDVMQNGNADSVAQALSEFFSTAVEPILFAGAGVSMLAGLPDWGKLLQEMAEAIRPRDPMTANQMASYVAKGSLTRAADFFLITDELLDSEKGEILKRILNRYDSVPLKPLASLPFKGVITTNFDRSIFDALAIARGRTAREYCLGDQKFVGAAFEQDLFVARIHGAVDYPPSIVLSDTQFRALLTNDAYLDVLSECMLRRSIIFLGFSFYDPAIKFVIERLEKKFGPALPRKHLALLPSTSSAELLTKATRLNLSVFKYDPTDGHAALWRGIEKFAGAIHTTPVRELVTYDHPYSVTKHYLAACYARSTASFTTPLREVVIEGIVSAVLQDAYPKGLSPADIYEGVRKAIGMKGNEIEEQVDDAIRELVDSKSLRKHRNPEGRGTKFAWTELPRETSTLSDALRILSDSVASRGYAMLGWALPQHVRDVVEVFLRDVVHQRGWDLGAAFAAGRAPDNVSYKSLLDECASKLAAFDKQRLAQIFDSLFISPTETESKLLGELGRISFALELAFQAPRSTLFHRAALPRRVYFDANFLMPAFVEGHPHNTTYRSALHRLLDASKRAGTPIQLVTSYGYLNEIISHKNLALEYAREAGADFEMVLRSDASYHGPAKINVFLGGFANSIYNGLATNFIDYMNKVAPYKSESDLRKWLEKQGILIVSSAKTPPYPEIYGLLERANSSRLLRSEGKEIVLVEHDAAQLTLLETDRSNGERSLFVTADRLLLNDIQAGKFSALSEFMISHVGLIQLIDVLIGLGDEDRSLGDLLWSSHLSERKEQLRTVLTLEALDKYNTALTMRMSDVAEAQAERVSKELERKNMRLDSNDPKRRVEAFRSLNTLKADFFENVGISTPLKKTGSGSKFS